MGAGVKQERGLKHSIFSLPVSVADPRLGGSIEMVMVERIFDHVPEIAFFIKDLHGRYAAVNQSLVDRLGVGGGLILGAKNPRGHNRHRSKANTG